MQITFTPDRRTASISFTPRQLAILLFLIEQVCTEDDIWKSFPSGLKDECIDDTFDFTRIMKSSLAGFCDKHFLPKGSTHNT
jgi:hypothetical protein